MRKQPYCILQALCQHEDFCRRRVKLLLAMMNSFACREHCVRLQANAMFPVGERNVPYRQTIRPCLPFYVFVCGAFLQYPHRTLSVSSPCLSTRPRHGHDTEMTRRYFGDDLEIAWRWHGYHFDTLHFYRAENGLFPNSCR